MQCTETNVFYHDNEKHLKLLSLLQFLWFNKHDKYEGEERVCPTEITHRIQWRYDSEELYIAHNWCTRYTSNISVVNKNIVNNNISLIAKGCYARNLKNTFF